MSRAAFQTSPLISFSHFPRGTRSYITASLALRSRQQATNHTEVNKHIARMNIPLSLRIRQWSWWWMNVMETKRRIRLWFSELGLFPNLPFNCDTVKLRQVLVTQTERLETRGFRAVYFIFFFFGDAESYYHSHLQWHWSALWLILPMHSVTLIAHSFFIYLFISFGKTSGTFDKFSPHSPSLNSSGWLLPPAPAVNLYIELFFVWSMVVLGNCWKKLLY